MNVHTQKHIRIMRPSDFAKITHRNAVSALRDFSPARSCVKSPISSVSMRPLIYTIPFSILVNHTASATGLFSFRVRNDSAVGCEKRVHRSFHGVSVVSFDSCLFSGVLFDVTIVSTLLNERCFSRIRCRLLFGGYFSFVTLFFLIDECANR